MNTQQRDTMNETENRLAPVITPANKGLLATMAAQYGLEPATFAKTLTETVFKGASREEFAMLCVISHKHGLNPLLRQIWAFPKKGGGITAMVSVDGWAKLVNDHPQFDGMDFEYATRSGAGQWIECVIHRKDRSHPTRIREFLDECKRDTDPWRTMPGRMLRNRAFVQCARLAFGYGDFADADAPTIDLGPAPSIGQPAGIEFGDSSTIAAINASVSRETTAGIPPESTTTTTTTQESPQ